MEYYCSNKFTQMQVHIQGRLLYNCHKAYPERVDLKWLEDNPGMLFYTDQMLADRKLMLQNKPCGPCNHGCYQYEKKGLISQRILDKNFETKITDPHAPLRTLQIMLSTDCNLACVYCSPEFSTKWQREVSNGGEYDLGGNSIANDNWSTLWGKIKQAKRSNETKFLTLLLREIELAKDLRRIVLLGGEPLLNNGLDDLIVSAQDKDITVITGLGISTDRLNKFVEKHKGSRIKFLISAESTNRSFEFIRHGSDWIDFVQKVDLIKKHGYEIEFCSVISNLCVFDFHNFYEQFSTTGKIHLTTLSGNYHMHPHVMDELSKKTCSEYVQTITDSQYRDNLIQMLEREPNDDERNTLGSYLRQLSTRRKCSLDFLPEHFLRWCGAIA